MELTVVTESLAEAAALLVRLLPGRSSAQGALLRADDDGIELSGGDGEVAARVRIPAVVHEHGEIAVGRRALAATLAGLTAAQAQLAAEGSRLVLRTPNARYALPTLDPAALPIPTAAPPAVGTVSGRDLRASAVPVASAVSREHALPIFTGVRVRSTSDGLTMLATDRFRMAAAMPPWVPLGDGEVDVLVPAAYLAEAAKLAASTEVVVIHADTQRFGLSWGEVSVFGSVLGQAFPDNQAAQLLAAKPDAEAHIEASELLGAVERATLYAGPHARVSIQLGDGVLVVRGNDEQAGESEEVIKADVRGALLTHIYQSRYLIDALHGFAGATVTMRIQAGTKPTVFARPDGQDPINLRYLVVPLRLNAH